MSKPLEPLVKLFLLGLYDALWMLFVNGRKPVLRMRQYSVARIRKNPTTGKGARGVNGADVNLFGR